MLSNCGAGEDYWESLGQQGDPTSQFQRKSVLNIHWKDWCWTSNTFSTWCKELTHWRRLMLGKTGQEEKGMTEDEMVGWHHWLNRHELEQILGDSEGQGSLVWHAAILEVAELDMTEWTTIFKANQLILIGLSNPPQFIYSLKFIFSKLEFLNFFRSWDRTYLK